MISTPMLTPGGDPPHIRAIGARPTTLRPSSVAGLGGLVGRALRLRIETHDVERGRVRRSRAWAAELDGTVYVRADGARQDGWSRDVAAFPWVTILVDDRPVLARAVRVVGTDRLDQINEAFLRRYGYHNAMPRLLARAAVAATFELVPLAAAVAPPQPTSVRPV